MLADVHINLLFHSHYCLNQMRWTYFFHVFFLRKKSAKLNWLELRVDWNVPTKERLYFATIISLQKCCLDVSSLITMSKNTLFFRHISLFGWTSNRLIVMRSFPFPFLKMHKSILLFIQSGRRQQHYWDDTVTCGGQNTLFHCHGKSYWPISMENRAPSFLLSHFVMRSVSKYFVLPASKI